MGLFGKKKSKKTTDESQRNGDFQEIYDMVKLLKEANADEYEINRYLYSNLPEGIVFFDGQYFWNCRSCPNGKRFESKKEYIAHQQSAH